MDKKIAVIISPNWGDYAKKYLEDFILSLRAQDYKGLVKVYLTDNETSPDSFKLLSSIAPEAELILNNTNRGYAGGCNDAIHAALKERINFDYIAIFNIHTILEPDCLRRMVEAAESSKNIGAVQARMMLWPEKDLVSSAGNITHFLGFGYCDGYKKPYNGGKKIRNIHYPSGSSFLVNRKVLEKVGLFDEEFWMYNEDQDLGWRIWLSGWRCVLAPEAVMYNKYEFQRSIQKFYWMDRNRILAILFNFRLLTLLLILPAFLVMELGHILFSLKTGWFTEKLRVWKYFLQPAKWKYIASRRKKSQALRIISDKKIASLLTGRIWYQEIDDWKLRIINPVFALYWSIIKSIIFW